MKKIFFLLLILTLVSTVGVVRVEAADTTVDSSVDDTLAGKAAPWGPYWINPSVGVIIMSNLGDSPQFTRTTDGGATWTPVNISDDTDEIQITAWFDRETPGFTSSNLIHVAWMRASEGIIKYRTVDVSDGTLGTERTVATPVSGETAGGSGSNITITKARNGNIILVARINSTVTDVSVAYRSDDDGATWDTITSPYESNSDSGLLFPANTGDGADAGMTYYDIGEAELSVKMYDDSAGTWTETAVASSIDPGNGVSVSDVPSQYDGSVRHSDGHFIFAIWNNTNLATADIKTYDINPNSIASPGVATGADVLTDTDESGRAAVVINQQNNDIYVGYSLGGTWEADQLIKYKLSDDDLATFEAEVDYSETSDDIRRMQGGRTIGASGGRIQWSFFDDDDNDLFVNLVNDVSITGTRTRYVNVASSGGDGTTSALSGSNAAYDSLDAALTGEAGDLTASDEILEIVLAAGTDTTAVTISGYTTDATRYIWLHPASGAEAGMPWRTSGAYILSASTEDVLDPAGQHVLIEDVQIEATRTESNTFVLAFEQAGNVDCYRCYLRLPTSSSNVRYFTTHGNFYNSVFYGEGEVDRILASPGFDWMNLTVVVPNRDSGTVIDPYFGNPSFNNTLVWSGAGAFHANIIGDNNASNDTSSPGASSVDSISDPFVDLAGGDFHLNSTGARILLGTNLSSSFTTDFDRDFRGTWNIGADEYKVNVTSTNSIWRGFFNFRGGFIFR